MRWPELKDAFSEDLVSAPPTLQGSTIRRLVQIVSNNPKCSEIHAISTRFSTRFCLYLPLSDRMSMSMVPIPSSVAGPKGPTRSSSMGNLHPSLNQGPKQGVHAGGGGGPRPGGNPRNGGGAHPGLHFQQPYFYVNGHPHQSRPRYVPPPLPP